MATLKPGVWIVKSFPYDRNLTAIPFKDNFRSNPADRRDADSVWESFFGIGDTTILMDTLGILNGEFVDAQFRADQAITHLAYQKRFQTSFLHCRLGTTAAFLTGNIQDSWNFDATAISKGSLIQIFKQDAAILVSFHLL